MSPPVDPSEGPKSGGTNITIMGSNIGTGSRHRVLVGRRECEITNVKLDSIMCNTPKSDNTSNGNVELVQVSVDNWDTEVAGFRYVDDPTFTSISPSTIFVA